MEIEEWKIWLKNMDSNEKEHFIKAIETLESFDVFKKEFEWTGIFKLKKYAKEIKNY